MLFLLVLTKTKNQKCKRLPVSVYTSLRPHYRVQVPRVALPLPEGTLSLLAPLVALFSCAFILYYLLPALQAVWMPKNILAPLFTLQLLDNIPVLPIFAYNNNAVLALFLG
jgi:hypothetical protein